MTWVPLPDFSAYYQLANHGASASMNCRQIISFNMHWDVQLAVSHLAWNISSALNHNEASYVEQFVSVCKRDVFYPWEGERPGLAAKCGSAISIGS